MYYIATDNNVISSNKTLSNYVKFCPHIYDANYYLCMCYINLTVFTIYLVKCHTFIAVLE